MYNADLDSIYAGLGGAVIIIGIFLIIAGIISLVGLWKLYKKAGKKGWEAIVPVYSYWVLFTEIAGLNWWYFLIYMILNVISNSQDSSLVADIGMLVINFFCYYNISKRIGKDTGYAVLMTLFPFVMFPIVGFSKNITFDASIPVSPNGPIKGNEVSETMTTSEPKTTSTTTSGPIKLKYCPYCGRPLESTEKFCGSCGNKLN